MRFAEPTVLNRKSRMWDAAALDLHPLIPKHYPGQSTGVSKIQGYSPYFDELLFPLD
jgi:hypothetical protein